MDLTVAPRLLVKTAFLLAVLVTGCVPTKPAGAFDEKKAPPAPDYSKPENWAALPDRADAADRVPKGEKDGQATAPVDVFFIHPTTYLGSRLSEKGWNAGLDDEKLNKKTDRTVEFQATAFNGTARVFAPRYRQTHIHNFVRKDRLEEAQRSLDLAHADVRAAFDYYLKNWNDGRPVIIAGHSQGSYHGMVLLKEYFDDGKPLSNKLVAAWLPGWPVADGFLKKIPPCRSPDEAGCYCSWRTYRRGYDRVKWLHGPNFTVTNPISWRTEPGRYVPKTESKGAVLIKFRTYPHLCDAEVRDGYLWTTKPKFRGSLFIRTSNYHPGDFNLFWFDVRANAAERTRAFLKK